MSNFTVATGFWQSYSHSGWEAWTLTLSVQDGALLISAIATFITIVGGRFWSIVAFSIHQIRATDDLKDGLHHQHQVVYRNGSTHLGAAWLIFRISCSWKSKAPRNWLRTIAFMLPPILCFAGFATAGVFSARVAAPNYTASQVRIAQNNCGYFDWHTPITDATTLHAGGGAYESWMVHNSIAAKNYARSCYSGVSQGQIVCDIFPVQKLPYSSRADAPCPFAERRCLLGENTAFEMSTPWLDSHIHFGINAPPPDRVLYRKTSTCSILNITDLTQKTTRSDGSTLYQYRLNLDGGYSYQALDRTMNDAFGYSIWPKYAINHDPEPMPWYPIAELNRTDADLSVFFLGGNSMGYFNPVDDPFFSAHRIFYEGAPRNETFFITDDLTRAMGCTDQFQLRNPTTNNTTLLGGLMSTTAYITTIGLNPAQIAAANRLIVPSSNSEMFGSVNGMQAASLKAQDSVFILMSEGLPANQWQIEVSGWFDTALAALQSQVLFFVDKSLEGIAPYVKLILPSNSPDTVAQCKQQIVRNVGAYQSFSVLGIGIIAIAGVIIILVSLGLDTIVGACQKKWGKEAKGKAKRRAWIRDSVLQIQRIAFESQDASVLWAKRSGVVPVTSKGMLLGWDSEREGDLPEN